MLSLVLLANVLFTPQEAIQIVFGEKADVMTRIAQCESGMRQFDAKGNVLISRTNDYGLFQVNKTNHAAAEKLGMDVTNPADNILFANYILQTQGLKAWKSSASCWKV